MPITEATSPLDVLIVGAGISGIGLACHLFRECPDKRYRILEARSDIGGTWDLFQYPGIRSDSDMYTFGFEFKPWRNPKTLSDGESIKQYLYEAADEHAVWPNIVFGCKVLAAAWDSDTALWSLTVEEQGNIATYQAKLLSMCSGYYDYAAGYLPDFPGQQDYQGIFIHPQHWPHDLAVAGKNIAVIGSGATAVTLVPALVERGAEVTMVQRSPTWVLSMPQKNPVNEFLKKILPARWAHAAIRWYNITFQNILYRLCRAKPAFASRVLLKRIRRHLVGIEELMPHFTPDYDPWSQRLCIVPDDDLFNALRSGQAHIVTAKIERLTENGLQLSDGEHVNADILVSATGLQLKLLGGVEFTLDGKRVDFSETLMYQGMMFSGVPNLFNTFGYVNASWTLRADLNAHYICGLIRKMDRTGAAVVTPDPEAAERLNPLPLFDDFNPGYIQRALAMLPKQGEQPPWQMTQQYLKDRRLLRKGPEDDGVLKFHAAQ